MHVRHSISAICYAKITSGRTSRGGGAEQCRGTHRSCRSEHTLIAMQSDRPMCTAISKLPNELRAPEPPVLRQGASWMWSLAGRNCFEEEGSYPTRGFGEAGKPRRLLLLV